MALPAQPLDDAPSTPIGEKAHAPDLRNPDFLSGEPGRVLEGLLDILALEVRVSLDASPSSVRQAGYRYRGSPVDV
jgi:hypothetical protein